MENGTVPKYAEKLFIYSFIYLSSNLKLKEMCALSPSGAWMCRHLQVQSGFWEPTSLLATTQSLTAAIIE